MSNTSRLAAGRISTSIALLVGVWAACLLSPATSQAKMFTNAYISFELPDKWDCVLEQTEWVCRPTAPDQAQQAIIILTAKEMGPGDALPSYEQHLKTPRQIQSRAGSLITSEVLNVYVNKVSDQPWVDGFHKASEIPNFLTRYLATTKDKIAVLITFSAHTLYYSKYANDFLRAISSLRVIAPKSLPAGSGGGGSDLLGGPVGFQDMGELPPEEGPGGAGEGGLGDKTKTVLAIAAILAAVGLYLMLKKKKRR